MFIWWNRKPETFDISLSRASHSIKNLTVDSKVYGDVEFWIMITENKQTILLIIWIVDLV
jgi:hypothetical protein